MDCWLRKGCAAAVSIVLLVPELIVPLELSSRAEAAPAAPTQVTVQPVIYLIPNDPAVLAPARATDRLLFRDIAGGVPSKRELILHDFSAETGSVERRTDNGTIGSGKRYAVRKVVTNLGEQTKVEFQPVSFTTYKQGLILPWPVPEFSDESLVKYLSSAELFAKLEIDSPYNSESTYANFVRLLKVKSNTSGESDPVSGKIFKQTFVASLRDREVVLTVETFPYRNGSKAVIYARIPATQTEPNTVDFGALLQELRTQLEAVVNA